MKKREWYFQQKVIVENCIKKIKEGKWGFGFLLLLVILITPFMMLFGIVTIILSTLYGVIGSILIFIFNKTIGCF
ncbi:MAG: hypothetical protein ACRC4M_05095 [Mycoplasma sp.]